MGFCPFESGLGHKKNKSAKLHISKYKKENTMAEKINLWEGQERISKNARMIFNNNQVRLNGPELLELLITSGVPTEVAILPLDKGNYHPVFNKEKGEIELNKCPSERGVTMGEVRITVKIEEIKKRSVGYKKLTPI